MTWSANDQATLDALVQKREDAAAALTIILSSVPNSSPAAAYAEFIVANPGPFLQALQGALPAGAVSITGALP